MRILFVCTGNTCRSPMAEGIFRQMLKGKETGVSCGSAGLAAADGLPPTPHAVEACREIGVDISGQRSRNLSWRDLQDTDLFVVMTKGHLQALAADGVPEAKIRVLCVPDPYGGTLEIYRQCRDAIQASLKMLVRDLGGCGSDE